MLNKDDINTHNYHQNAQHPTQVHLQKVAILTVQIWGMVRPQDNNDDKPKEKKVKIRNLWVDDKSTWNVYHISRTKHSLMDGSTKSSEATSHLLPKATRPGIFYVFTVASEVLSNWLYHRPYSHKHSLSMLLKRKLEKNI